jgi:hypothetical protein
MQMQPIIVTMSPEATQTRVLAVLEGRDVLKAVLPSPTSAHPQAARTLLEGLALWHNQPLSVVLSVDDLDGSSSALQLYDALGYGVTKLHFEVAVTQRERRRARRMSGVGDFRDLRQLRLEVDR